MIIQSKKYRFLAFVAAALFSLASPKALAQSGPPAGQQPSEEAALNALADGAVKALQSGDYATAAAKFEELSPKIPPEAPQLEEIFFMLGAAYFNLEQYDKAVENFKKYQEKFPKGNHAQDVAFNLAQALHFNNDKGQSHIFTYFVFAEEEMPLCLYRFEGVRSPGSNVGRAR